MIGVRDYRQERTGRGEVGVVELGELIRELRGELQKAMAEGQGDPLRFELGPVELELTVGVNREAAGKGGVRFWVIELGSDGKVARESTQRITLTLQPVLAATGRPAVVPGLESDRER